MQNESAGLYIRRPERSPRRANHPDINSAATLQSCIDVVLCQQGLRFFPDKLAALREMHRVLVPGGRVLLSVWKSAGPYNVAVGDALERHVGAACPNGIIETMELLDHGRTMLTRVIRAGDQAPGAWQADNSTPEARMEAVWELTLLCLAWRTEPPGEPRLQRSVVRIQRSRR